VNAVPLADARDERAFGGKAVQLGVALRAGLPVPDGKIAARAWEATRRRRQ
jgi:phosphoenolpyruvate synthase/pyruvate phosphate dikinase